VEVAEAVGGLEALELLAKEDWDVVLTDIRMPGVDGLALARRLRRREQEEGRRSTPLIAVTAQGEEHVAEESRAGLNDRLSKPYRRADLAALLRRWLPAGGDGKGVEIEPAVRPWQATRAALEALSQKTGEDEVAKAVASFQESAALHLEAMESAWQAQDWERIGDPLHSLSGTAEFLGGAAVVATAAEIRRHIDMGNRMEGALLGRLRREIDETALRCLQDGSNAPDHEEGGSGQQQAEKG
jgi:CheY-like chemotaxis protein/HPt (histidine-containing phosphotransfer) domain-containing protein